MSLLRSALFWVFRRVVRIYFRGLEEAGSVPGAETGGRVFVANHNNAIVDPILVLTSAPCAISPVAKSTLWAIPGLRWLLDQVDAVPIVRRRDDPTKAGGSNEEVFDKVAAWLSGGGNILIFPEGTSHSAPHLLEVKSGAARMLARAHAKGARGLTLQAVALEFDQREVFRSRCLLLYGPVRSIDALGLDGEALVTAVTRALKDDLSELLVEGVDWEERVLIARVAEMLANDTGDRTLARWNEIGRQVEAARAALRHSGDAGVAATREAVDHYFAGLAAEGLTDADFAPGATAVPSGFVLSGLFLVAILPLAVAGTLLFALPYQLPRLAGRSAKNVPDEISTRKLGAGLVVFPLWAAALVAVSFACLPVGPAVLAAVTAIASPFAALAWLDRTPALRRSLHLVARGERLAGLRARRARAMELVDAARARLGV